MTVVTSVSVRRRCALVDPCVTIIVMSGYVQKIGGVTTMSAVLTVPYRIWAFTIIHTAAVAAISPANVSLMARSTTVNITTVLTGVTRMCLVREVRQL